MAYHRSLLRIPALITKISQQQFYEGLRGRLRFMEGLPWSSVYAEFQADRLYRRVGGRVIRSLTPARALPAGASRAKARPSGQRRVKRLLLLLPVGLSGGNRC